MEERACLWRQWSETVANLSVCTPDASILAVLTRATREGDTTGCLNFFNDVMIDVSHSHTRSWYLILEPYTFPEDL